MSTNAAVDTTSLHVTRMLIKTGHHTGVDWSACNPLPAGCPVNDDRVRISLPTLMRVWEAMHSPLHEAGGAQPLIDVWQPGSLGVWDYLFATAPTLAEALDECAAHVALVASDNDALRVDREPQGISVTWTSVLPDHPTSPLIAEFAIGIILTEARWATGRRLVPARVELPQSAPKYIDSLVRLYGTDRIEFEADRPSISFSYADGARRLPKADPALAGLLRSKARLTLDTSRPVLGWLDTFRDALEAEIATGAPDLKNAARRLTVAPRTLQRRLDQEGTSWRDELDQLRQARVDRLLKETKLSVEAIAPRVGYSDPRTLRRAISRWYGHGAATVRAEARR